MLFLLLLSIITASLNSAVLHKAKLTKKGSIYKFNLLCAVVWCICLFVVNGGKLHLKPNALLWGCVYGVIQALFILFKTAAMNSGPVSITTLIGNASLVVSVVACLFLWDEPISIADVSGLCLLMTGIVLTTYKKPDRGVTKFWKLYTLLFLLCAAGVGITFKAFSKSGSTDCEGDMMLISACIMLFSYTVICCFTGCFKSQTEKKNQNSQEKKDRIVFILFALISGLFSCLYNRLNIYLSGAMDGVIFFPSFNGGVILLSTLLSVILLKEKVGLKQVLGILIGITGICIIGIL